MTLPLRDRINFGARSRGFANPLADEWPMVCVHANGQEIHIGKRACVKVLDSDGKLRKATSWEVYMLAKDGDLWFYNGLRASKRDGMITRAMIEGVYAQDRA